jgi:hypothetical protein
MLSPFNAFSLQRIEVRKQPPTISVAWRRLQTQVGRKRSSSSNAGTASRHNTEFAAAGMQLRLKQQDDKTSSDTCEEIVALRERAGGERERERARERERELERARARES